MPLVPTFDIKGVNRGGLEYKVSLYTNDMLLYISDLSSGFLHLLKLLNEFGQLSGYKVNFQKSELMPVGTLNSDTVFSSIPFKISAKKFRYLGVWITHNYNDLYKANYQQLLSHMKQDFDHWDSLSPLLGGRINSIKTTVSLTLIPLYLSKSTNISYKILFQ